MNREGFTFIEVLFALFIAAGIILAVSGTVVLSLRAEEANRERRHSVRVWNTLQTTHHLNGEITKGKAFPQSWHLEKETLELGIAPTQTVWKVYHVSSPRRTFRQILSFRDHEETLTRIPVD